MGGMADGPADLLVKEKTVCDTETVCRLGFAADFPASRDGNHSQTHDPETMLIRLEEFSLDDLNKNGFSLQRVCLYSQEAALAEAARRNADKSDKHGFDVKYRVSGGHFFQVSAVHAIVDGEGSAIFKVLETPTKEEPAHAEIRAHAKVTNSQKLKYRKALREVLGPLKGIDGLPLA